MHTSDYIDRLNYLNDPRVRAAAVPATFASICTRTMTGIIKLEDAEHTIGFAYGVCDTCDGRGTHTNPSLDAGGLDFEDMDDDDIEAYADGRYDVACYECKGRRVVPVPAPRSREEREVLDRLRKMEEEAELSRAEQRAELAMGA